jgi:hypothetical protein
MMPGLQRPLSADGQLHAIRFIASSALALSLLHEPTQTLSCPKKKWTFFLPPDMIRQLFTTHKRILAQLYTLYPCFFPPSHHTPLRTLQTMIEIAYSGLISGVGGHQPHNHDIFLIIVHFKLAPQHHSTILFSGKNAFMYF